MHIIHRVMPRRVAAILVLTSILSLGPATTADSSDGLGGPRVAPPPTRICPIDWHKSMWAIKRLIRCAAEYHGLSQRKALAIAHRESRYQPRAYNSQSCAKGIYQHLCRYWFERASEYGFEDHSPYNARANIFVTMRMVKRHGWWPWGG